MENQKTMGCLFFRSDAIRRFIQARMSAVVRDQEGCLRCALCSNAMHQRTTHHSCWVEISDELRSNFGIGAGPGAVENVLVPYCPNCECPLPNVAGIPVFIDTSRGDAWNLEAYAYLLAKQIKPSS